MFRVGGQVINPKTYHLADLQALPTTRVHDVFIAGTGVSQGTFTGVLLWDLIEAAVVDVNPNQPNDLLRHYVLITDGPRSDLPGRHGQLVDHPA
jgi:hypothetical protein